MRFMGVTALAMLAIDQLSKYWVVFQLNLLEYGAIDVFPPYLNFRMGWNTGVNFGLLDGYGDLARWILIFLASAVCVWVALWARQDHRPLPNILAGILIGGALGNALDRLIHGAVADFLNMSCCGIQNPYTFNIADIGVFVGAIGLAIWPPQRDHAKAQ
ncbi:MAG: signal peptidase II [Mangrovicoccus sp.]